MILRLGKFTYLKVVVTFPRDVPLLTRCSGATRIYRHSRMDTVKYKLAQVCKLIINICHFSTLGKRNEKKMSCLKLRKTFNRSVCSLFWTPLKCPSCASACSCACSFMCVSKNIHLLRLVQFLSGQICAKGTR